MKKDVVYKIERGISGSLQLCFRITKNRLVVFFSYYPFYVWFFKKISIEGRGGFDFTATRAAAAAVAVVLSSALSFLCHFAL